MSALDIASELDETHIAQIAQQIGADPAQTRSAIDAAAPLLLGGMAQTAQQPQGGAAVQQAVQSHAGVLDNLGQILGAAGVGDAGGLLGRILGQHQSAVQSGVQQTSGLNGDQTRRLLTILAPIVLAMIAKRRQQGGASTPLNTHLRDEAEQAQRKSPQVGGILGKILSHVEAPNR
jgi:hypothetical protein